MAISFTCDGCRSGPDHEAYREEHYFDVRIGGRTFVICANCAVTGIREFVDAHAAELLAALVDEFTDGIRSRVQQSRVKRAQRSRP